MLYAFALLSTVNQHGFDLDRSFQILFIVIIGGLGSLLGAFLGAAFIVLLPILLGNLASTFLSGIVEPGHVENLQKVLFGSLIVFFLIKEPEGLARLLHSARHRTSRFGHSAALELDWSLNIACTSRLLVELGG